MHEAVQTLGEEYTDIWQHSAFGGKVPSRASRIALVLLPTLPSYILAKWGSHLSSLSPKMASALRVLPMCFEVAAEVNLAIFYLRGTYYDLTKRMLGIQHVITPVSLSHARDAQSDGICRFRPCRRTHTPARRRILYSGSSSSSAFSTGLYTTCAPVATLPPRNRVENAASTRHGICLLMTDS